ncbi:MAG: ribonuclease VapC [Solirubrobacterales bacterium]|jgi:uncharacterized protein with PIN domain|nr:ribonuclease VapC [Solirubrobacterales bacterium]
MAEVCLDSWAVLAWLDGEEPAAGRVQAEIDRGRPGISWVNLVEIHYRLIRDHGRESADQTLDDLRDALEEELPGVERMREVARLKAEHPIALGDCFAIATATAAGSALITGDPEIVERAPALTCEVIDARQVSRPRETQ